MNSSLAIVKNDISLWECENQINEIKEVYGKNLNKSEFSILLQIGRATGLNPFLRELWAVKYGDNPAQIFIGRDGYRKSAQANPNYDYHHVEAVYSNDDLNYSVTNGEVTHKQDFKNRGNLLGAYCIVKKKSASRPIYVFVELKEYNTNKSLWASKPATMIKKVAEAQCLRMAFQDIFGGTYADEEYQPEKEINPEVQATIDHHKIIEGTPISQSDKMDQDLLDSFITGIENCKDKKELLEIYKEAKLQAKNDKKASDDISLAAKKKQEELNKAAKDQQESPLSNQSNDEWLKAHAGENK